MSNPRGSLCLQCRTVLGPGESCDISKGHHVVRLDLEAERRRAVDAVWGPPHLRARQVAATGATGGGTGAVIEGCGNACSGCDGAAFSGEVGAVIFAIVVVAIVFVLVYWIAKKIAYWIKSRRDRLRPRGAERLKAPPEKMRGKVTAAVGDEAPSGLACAAWGIELLHSDATASRVTLRDGHTRGLSIELEDGRRVEIPAGRCRLLGDGVRSDTAALVANIDPRPNEDHPAVPHDSSDLVLLQLGDELDVLGTLEPRPDPKAPATGYRDAPPMIHVPAGVAWLRKV